MKNGTYAAEVSVALTAVPAASRHIMVCIMLLAQDTRCTCCGEPDACPCCTWRCQYCGQCSIHCHDQSHREYYCQKCGFVGIRWTFCNSCGVCLDCCTDHHDLDPWQREGGFYQPPLLEAVTSVTRRRPRMLFTPACLDNAMRASNGYGHAPSGLSNRVVGDPDPG